MKRYKAYIYGAGSEYNRLMSYLPLHDVEVGGVLTTGELYFSYIDGHKIIRPEESEQDSDLFIIAIEKWKDPYRELRKIGIADEKIIRAKAFYNPCFNLENYLTLKKSKCSVICNNCLGGIIFEELGLEYLSPTKNMGCLKGEEFVDYANNIEKYIDAKLNIIKWQPGVDNSWDCYDRIMVGEKVTFWLNHNVCAEDIVDDWKKRSQKINTKNIAVIMTLRNRNDIDSFLKLKHTKKIGIYFEDVRLRDVMYLPEWKDPKIRFAYGGRWDDFVTRHMSYHFEGGMAPVDWISFLIGKKNCFRRTI